SGPSRLGGRLVSVVEIARALRVVAAAAGPLAGVVAHSAGATATALALRDGWPGPSPLVLVSPFALPSTALQPFARAMGVGGAVAARLRSLLAHRLGRPWDDFDLPALAGVRNLPGLLLVHDREDPEVPFAHGVAVVRAWT